MPKLGNVSAFKGRGGKALSVVPATVGGEHLRPPRVAYKLTTPKAWLKELSNIYRATRRGQLTVEELSRLAYACNVGAKLSEDIETGERLEAIRKELQRLESATPSAYAIQEAATP